MRTRPANDWKNWFTGGWNNAGVFSRAFRPSSRAPTAIPTTGYLPSEPSICLAAWLGICPAKRCNTEPARTRLGRFAGSIGSRDALLARRHTVTIWLQTWQIKQTFSQAPRKSNSLSELARERVRASRAVYCGGTIPPELPRHSIYGGCDGHPVDRRRSRSRLVAQDAFGFARAKRIG